MSSELEELAVIIVDKRDWLPGGQRHVNWSELFSVSIIGRERHDWRGKGRASLPLAVVIARLVRGAKALRLVKVKVLGRLIAHGAGLVDALGNVAAVLVKAARELKALSQGIRVFNYPVANLLLQEKPASRVDLLILGDLGPGRERPNREVKRSIADHHRV